MVRWLLERGLDAQGFKTEYGDEDVADQAAAPAKPLDAAATQHVTAQPLHPASDTDS